MKPIGRFQIQILDLSDLGLVNRVLDSAAQAHRKPRMTTTEFLWKNRDSPFGHSTVAIALTGSGEVAGAVSFGRYRLRLNDQPVEAALSYETFVHPSYQRMGLFGALSNAAVQSMQERGARLFFNFPNASSAPGFRKFGWAEVGGIVTWLKPVRLCRLLSPRRLRDLRAEPFAPDQAIESDAAAAVQLASFDVSAGWRSAKDVLVPERTQEFLRWRLFTHPRYRYHLVPFSSGGVLVRTGSRGSVREAQVLEFVGVETWSATILREGSRAVASATDSDVVNLTVSSGHPACRDMRLQGAVKVPNRISFMTLPGNPGFPKVFLSATGWSLTALDFHMH